LKKHTKTKFESVLVMLRVLFVALVAVSLFVVISVTARAGAKATAARVAGDENRTRFVADVSQAVSFTVYVLPDPYRVVIDLPDVNFDLPKGVGRKVRGLIKEFRYGMVEEGRSRIVIDTNGPVLIEKSFLVPPKASQPSRIVVDLVTTTEDEFAAAFEASQVAAKDETPKQPEAEATTATADDESAASAAEPDSAASAENETPAAIGRPSGKRLIVLDPGHGGIDPGARSPRGTKEKDVVFAMAQAIRRELLATGRYEVKLTREGDKFLALPQRREMARKLAADLFIAIHADTVRGPSARGMTIYTLSDKASDAEAEALASKENRVDIIAGLDLETENPEVTNILIDLAQRESKNHAMLFSKRAVGELKPLTLMTGKPQRSAGFIVLKAPDVPSVLVELGYLSSKQDEALLTSKAWHGKIAKAMTRAVDKYFSSEVAARSP
jgi:N-acetylmuramoyl-L-alanine amidase